MVEKKKSFSELSPGKKRLFALLGAAGVVIIFASASEMLFSPASKDKAPKNDVQRNVLTDTNTRQLGIDGLSASVQRMRREITELSNSLGKYMESQEAQQKNRNLELDKELASIKKDIREMKVQSENTNSQLRQDIRRAEQNNQQRGSNANRSGARNEKEPKAQSDRERSFSSGTSSTGIRSNRGVTDPTELFSSVNTAQTQAPAPRSSVEEDSEEEETVVEKTKPMTIHVINAAPPEKVKRERANRIKEKSEAAPKEIEFYMPTGSIISAMLLNGIDASTSTSARSEPMPALLRVEKDAILPNRFTSDIKDCFVLVSGHGDLSSERAFLRGEYLSCVRNDGAVLETKFPSYVVGEDGKAGMRGRLVSKQGQMIARTLIAGFASGVSKAFDVTPVSVLDTTSIGGSVQYQNNFNSGLARGAAAQGASQALEKVADFYIKMAEQIFPVVEITAGRRVDIVVTNGTKLRLKNLNELSDSNTSTPTVQTNPVIRAGAAR